MALFIALTIVFCFSTLQAQERTTLPRERSTLQAQERSSLVVGRKMKVGDKYLLTTLASYRMRLALDMKDHKPTDSTYADSVHLQALVEVTSVTEAGEEHAKTLTIRYFHRYINNVTIDLLPNGAVVKASFDTPASTYTVNGEKPSAQVDELLRLAVRSEGGTQTGDILNPPKPVRVGDNWVINKKAFALGMATGATKNQAKGITGKVRYAGIDTLNNRPCATVIAVIRQKLGAGTQQSPAQTNAYDMTVSVPLDVRYPASATTVRSRVRVDSRGKGLKMTQQTDVTIESTFDR